MGKSLDDTVILIAKAEENKKETEVYAEIQSVKRTEFYKADTNGYKATISVTVNPEEFKEAAMSITLKSGKTKKLMTKYLTYAGNKYKIIRTFEVNEFEMEITCEEAE